MYIVEFLLDIWLIKDEWYLFVVEFDLEGVEYVIIIDEDSYVLGDLVMGGVYFIVWKYCVKEGCVMYIVIGYCEEMYDVLENIILIKDVFKWILGYGVKVCVE